MKIDQLIEATKAKKNPCVVGLDPEWNKLPACYQVADASRAECIWRWARDVIDCVVDVVAAVKPQMAFYEVYGAEGVSVFERIAAYAHEKGLLVIDDSKRGDIGNTARAYAFAHLAQEGPINADFLTVSPWLGTDSLQPFLDEAERGGKGLFVLVKTSNPSSGEVSEAVNAQGQRLRDWLADWIEQMGEMHRGINGYAAIGAVVGATFPQEARELRQKMRHSYFLVPGFGAQGGRAADVAACFNDDGLGAVVNSSRDILYPHLQREDYDGTRRLYLQWVRERAELMQRQVYAALREACCRMEY